ncbi:hypothetical protein JCM19237_5844 [Photobacterium aphoticum]|uniref:Uncharacterized protein n=1 Tax=Photobacterium aphoticum TaxID=754436 RepID=A0A090QJ60_9GAMM|nr:hypothetical protein JCM19237_5844 [Photobacterium aphoticum]
MPLLFWPLLLGTVGFVGGLFTGEAVGRTLKILVAVLMGFWLLNITGVTK